jgi:hypothetical protein
MTKAHVYCLAHPFTGGTISRVAKRRRPLTNESVPRAVARGITEVRSQESGVRRHQESQSDDLPLAVGGAEGETHGDGAKKIKSRKATTCL